MLENLFFISCSGNAADVYCARIDRDILCIAHSEISIYGRHTQIHTFIHKNKTQSCVLF